jgi:putative hydrolase of the HAD superfamily
MSDVKLVVFDLGRVLIRICDNWRHACEVARVPTPVAEMDAAARAAMRELVALHETGRVDHARFAESASPLLGVPPECVLAMSNAYLLGPFPGVDELLDDLSTAGVATACLSNTNASHWDLMCAQDGPAALPMHRLTWRFGSQEIGLRKPDPAIYAHFEKSTSFAPNQIVFFDDLEENIAGARSRGWHGLGIAPDRDPASQMRDELGRLRVL